MELVVVLLCHIFSVNKDEVLSVWGSCGKKQNVKDETVKLGKMYISELLSDFKYSNSEGLYSVILTPPHTHTFS